MQAIACIINYFVDTSHIWANYEKMAKLSLQGKTVATPANYNEREYQHQIIKNQKRIPDTIVIGSSRGMFLGKEILKQSSVYNHCISGGCIMDYFALLGLYQIIWRKMPSNIIIEISPWMFSNVSQEKRWQENQEYAYSAITFYDNIICKNSSFSKYSFYNNPIYSFPYLYTNITKTMQNLIKFGVRQGFLRNKLIVRESQNNNEQADLPDGVIRYPYEIENKNESRTKKVKESSKKAVSYQNCDKMESIDQERFENFVILIDYLQKQKVNITFFLAPFSETQSKYIYENNTNPVFKDIEKALTKLAIKHNIKLIGSYDASKYNLKDESFSDFMHGDKDSINLIWNNR
jgi:hypothetical protein